MDEFKAKSYKGVVDKLKERYADKDKAQRIFTISWLELYKNIQRERGADLGEYITNYHNMSQKLVETRVISTFLQGTWFLQGLPEKIQEIVVRRAQVNVNKLETVEYRRMKKIVEEVDDITWIINHLHQKEYQGEESKEMLDEFEGIKDQHSTTMVQLDGRYPERKEYKTNGGGREGTGVEIQTQTSE